MGTLSANLSPSSHLCLSPFLCNAELRKGRRRESIIGCSLRQSSSCPLLFRRSARKKEEKQEKEEEDMALIPRRASKVVKASQRKRGARSHTAPSAGLWRPTDNIRFLLLDSSPLPLSRVSSKRGIPSRDEKEKILYVIEVQAPISA